MGTASSRAVKPLDPNECDDLAVVADESASPPILSPVIAKEIAGTPTSPAAADVSRGDRPVGLMPPKLAALKVCFTLY